jgi:transglutaminase-like putative cysteine protease
MTSLEDALRPREGWRLLILLMLSGIFLTGAVTAANWVERDNLLLPLAVLALLLGRWGAHRQWTAWGQVLLAVDTGLLTTLSLAAGGPHRWGDLIPRWKTWVQVALWGGYAEDATIFLLYVSMLVWVGAFFAGWWYGRDRNALVGFSPALLLSALSVFYAERGTANLFIGLFLILLLTARIDLRAWEENWQRRETSYASDLTFDRTVTAGLIAGVLVVLGLLMPLFRLQPIIRWVSETFARPATQVESEAERLFGGVRPPEREGEFGAGPRDRAYLPRLHLLGGRPELEELEVLRIEVDPGFRPYWRGATYDVYTGQGWQITVAAEGPTGTLPLPPAPAYQTVVQRVAHTRRNGGPVYALAEPIAVALVTETVALWHEPGDLAGLRVDVPTYTVISRVARPTPAHLRAAPADYPPEIAERYLQLPESVPRRVQVLTEEIAAGEETPFDRAARLEEYLRSFPYTLDLDRPPPDVDVADHFLFTLQRGYCDYYATAFVVMARTVGLPSRLATGYAGGERDPDNGELVVVEGNAHSWPEVYFPGWGWVRFEPTAGRDADQPGPQAPGAPSDQGRRGFGPIPPWLRVGGLVTLGTLFLGAVIWVGWRAHRQREEAALTDLPHTWRHIVALGRRLEVPHRAGQTVLEYTAALSDAVTERAETAHWGAARWKAWAAEARELLQAFGRSYSHYLYGGGSPSEERSWARVKHLIARLRWVPLDRAIIRLVWPRSAGRSSR